jgi:hypothetical protein
MVLLENINVTLVNAKFFKPIQAPFHQARSNAAFSVCRQDYEVLQVAATTIVAWQELHHESGGSGSGLKH